MVSGHTETVWMLLCLSFATSEALIPDMVSNCENVEANRPTVCLDLVDVDDTILP